MQVSELLTAWRTRRQHHLDEAARLDAAIAAAERECGTPGNCGEPHVNGRVTTPATSLVNGVIVDGLPRHCFPAGEPCSTPVMPPTDTTRSRPGVRRGRLPNGVSMADRRAALVAYLTRVGSATRTQILTDTGIPNGTLSSLLAKPSEFAKDGKAWRVAPAVAADAVATDATAVA